MPRSSGWAFPPSCPAAVSGYFSIRLLRFVAEKGRFGAFSYYCWAAGVITLALSVMKSTSGLPWLGA